MRTHQPRVRQLLNLNRQAECVQCPASQVGLVTAITLISKVDHLIEGDRSVTFEG